LKRHQKSLFSFLAARQPSLPQLPEVAVKMFSRSKKAKKRFLVTFQHFQDYDEYR